MLKRLLVPLLLLALAPLAAAQNTINFAADTVTGNGQVTPTLTWSTTPAADDCVASGSWSGSKGPSGSELIGPLTSSGTYNLTCNWQGDSIATVAWVNPTENTDGSAYTDPAGTRLMWSAVPGTAFDCENPDADPAAQWADRPAGQVMHTITGLTPATWTFVAFARNQLSICSGPSNLAAKTITATVSVNESVGITVNPVPREIGQLTVD